MKCLQCGYCCYRSWVVIVDDPKKGVVESNLIEHKGDGTPCKHLIGNKENGFECAIHNEPWYKQTPCYSHGQIEQDVNDVCRMGEYVKEHPDLIET